MFCRKWGKHVCQAGFGNHRLPESFGFNELNTESSHSTAHFSGSLP
ncbi:hypothetical protein EIKCOROL_01047 [Eikenella corrodens ATCC 23834]|uniref:Uncharacterized protein n=1 Tax=Eikenella corrodens ATCC 23834 TaxID=546274 RepID=C0DUL4_EIKCO|nr:hypothetical protein EIKCOROL_01047 [Eikenella corrodens ATCC 23834]